MELISLSVLISLAALFIYLLFTFHLSGKRTQSLVPGSMLPPGTYGWPIIGESLEFLKTTFVEERMQKYSSQIFKTSILGESVAVFCSPEVNKCLFTNEKQRVTRWYPNQIEKIFHFSRDALHEEPVMRILQLFREFLNTEALQSHVGVMDSVARDQLKNNWENKTAVNVSSLSKAFTFSLGCKLILSIDSDDDPIQMAKLHEQFDNLVNGFLSVPLNLWGTPFNKAMKASNYLRKYLVERIKQRKMELADGKKQQDIFSQMRFAYEDGRKSTTEAEADTATSILALLVAADVASVVITLIVKYLAELPHIYDQVLKEQREILKAKSPGELLNWEDVHKMKYSWNVACEVMRLESPARGAFREAVTDITFAGFFIPKGWKLYWNYSTHKNAKYFPDPEKFDPSRFDGNGPAPYTYVPFGGGRYRCPGNAYARMEILVFMHNLVTKFKWEKMILDEKVFYTPFPTMEKGLPIRLQSHVS